MKKTWYNVIVEGAAVAEQVSYATAARLQRRYEAEGWNVAVYRVHMTVSGPMGVRV